MVKKVLCFYFIILPLLYISWEYYNYINSEIRINIIHHERDLLDSNYSIPWPGDLQCSRYVTRFGANIPLTYLASYPRSGNTWMRYLIEGATGIFTGSVYSDERLHEDVSGFLGETDEWNSGRTIVVKIHPRSMHSNPLLSLVKTPVIFILRNPFKSIASFWDFLYASRIGRRKEAFQFSANVTSYSSKDFHHHVKLQTLHWEQSASFLITMTRNLHVVFYEDLVENTIGEVQKILTFMKLPSHKGRFHCIKKYLDGKAKRQFKVDIDPYTVKERIELTNALANVIGLLKLRDIQAPKSYQEILFKRTYLTSSQQP